MDKGENGMMNLRLESRGDGMLGMLNTCSNILFSNDKWTYEEPGGAILAIKTPSRRRY